MEPPLVSHFISKDHKEMDFKFTVLYVANKKDSNKDLLRREAAWVFCLNSELIGGGGWRLNNIDLTCYL